MLFGRQRQTSDAGKEKSRKVTLFRKGNPTRRPILSQLYGILACLVVSLALLGVVIFLKKTLPDGSRIGFAPTAPTLNARAADGRPGSVPARVDVRAVEEVVVERRQGSFIAPGNALGPNPFASFLVPNSLIFFSPTVSCTTIVIPARARRVKRAAFVSTSCETNFVPVTRTPAPAPATPTTPPPAPVTPTRPADPCFTTHTSCPPVFFNAAVVSVQCVTSIETAASCQPATNTSTSVPRVPTTPPVVCSSPTFPNVTCETLTIVERRDPTLMVLRREIFTTCNTTCVTPPTTPTAPTTPAPVTNSCLSTSTSCPPIILRRDDVFTGSNGCVTRIFTRTDVPGCVPVITTNSTTAPPTTPTTPPPITNSCLSTSTSCPPIILRRDDVVTGTDGCVTTTFTRTDLPGCLPVITTNTTTVPPVTLPPTNTSTVPPVTVPPTNSSTVPPVTLPPTNSSTVPPVTTAPPSTNTCLGSTVSCTTLGFDAPIIPRQEGAAGVVCSTSFFILPECITTNTSSVVPPTTVTTSTSTSTPDPVSTSTVPPPTSTSSEPPPVIIVPDTSSSVPSVPPATVTVPDITSSPPVVVVSDPPTTPGQVNSNPPAQPPVQSSSDPVIPPVIVAVPSSVAVPSQPPDPVVVQDVPPSAPPAQPQPQTQPSNPPAPAQPQPQLSDPAAPPASVPAPSNPPAQQPPSPDAPTSPVPAVVPPPSTAVPESMQVPSNSVSAPPTDSATPATPTDTGAPGSGGGGGGGGSDSPMQPQQPDPVVWPTFPTSKTLLGNYTPLIVGRGISLLLSGMFSVLALHDPVRHLTSLGGANGAQLMGATVGVSDAGSFVALLGGGLSAGLTYVDTNWCEAERQPGNLNPCPPRLTQTPWVVDVIIGTLVVQTALIAVAAAQWFKRPSGLSADPTTIAGVAAVMGHPEVERQFASYPAEMTSAQLAKEIKTQQWKLGTFYTAAGAVKYGIMPVPESERRRKGRQSAKGTPNEGGFFTRISIKLGLWKESIKWLRDWKNNRLYFDLVFIMLLLALIGLTAAAVAHVDRPQVVFLAAAGNGVGMRIFFAILGIIVSVYWGRIFQDAQTFTPYILLSEGDGAPPKTTILLSRHSVPFTAFFPLLFAGHFGAASVAFTGIFAELLIIFLAGLPYRPGQLRGEFLFCGVSALAILAIMLVQVIAINIWRRRLPHLPRRPDNIAAVMTYVAATGMARDFDGLEGLSVRERNKAIVDMGKNYAYGWRREEIMPMPAGVPGGMEYHSGYATNAGTAGGSRVRWVIDQVAGDEGKSLMVRGSEDTRV